MSNSRQNPWTRATLRRAARRGAPLAIALAALLLLLGACQQAGGPTDATNDGSVVGVLGTFDFSFDGLGSDTVTASATRIDDGGAQRLSLGADDIVTSGLSLSFLAAKTVPVGDHNYVYAEFRVRYTGATPLTLTNLTFLGYQNAADNDGTAFQNSDAESFRPTLGGSVDADTGDVLKLSNADALSLVVLDESDITDLEAYVGDLSFATTAFPYGFVVSTLDGSRGRTIGDGVDGVLRLGFRVPSTVTEINWRAVSVTDSEYRLALPYEYSGRDVDGTDNLAAFLDEVVKVSEANDGTAIQATVIGDASAVPGKRVLQASTSTGATRSAKDAFGDGAYAVRALADVRLAGTSVSPITHWVSTEATPNAVATPVYLLEEFTASGTFTPPMGINTVDYLVVAGGGGGGAAGNTAETNNGAGGGGGAGGLRSAVDAALPGTEPITVTVGAGGAGGSAVDPVSKGSTGDDSVFGSITAAGGGGGGTSVSGSFPGDDGGSGGGGGAPLSNTTSAGGGGGASPEEQGNDGGTGRGTGPGQLANRAGGGGGGAGAPGSNAEAATGGSGAATGGSGAATGGSGGAGVASTITGFEREVAGGGGGSARTGDEGTATAGGGAGAVGTGTPVDGTVNTGGGGGGAAGAPGASGGSGIVIIRYSVTTSN